MAVLSDPFTRRRLLGRAAKLAAASFVLAAAPKVARASPWIDYPFKLGVASGDPIADGFVIWTRLAPDPLDERAMPPDAVPVTYEVAADEGMRRIVKRGTTLARAENAHAVHVDVQGLAPDRPYWYRFIAGGEVSPVGRGRTVPVLGAPKDRLRFAFASCQHYGQGYFSSYRRMAADDPDLILHLGDYIYEAPWGPKVRWHMPEAFSLSDYRAVHALYKTDPDLQAAHAACPWAVIWDDHEVVDDYASGSTLDREDPERFLERRAAAYKAYFEHMPLRAMARPRGAAMRLHTSIDFGDLARFTLLDGRQYRSDGACGGLEVAAGCSKEATDAASMLGEAQERWLFDRLSGKARWKVIAQQQLFAEVDVGEPDDSTLPYWSGGWSGFPACRRRILGNIADRRLDNVVMLGGDNHEHWVADLKLDDKDPKAAVLATEFTTTSITSEGGGWARNVMGLNPHIKFNDWRHRGYMRVDLTPERWRTDLMATANVADPDSPCEVLASFTVENGRPGAQRDGATLPGIHLTGL